MNFAMRIIPESGNIAFANVEVAVRVTNARGAEEFAIIRRAQG
jgi:hypothetical protein